MEENKGQSWMGLGEAPLALRDGDSGPTASLDLEHPFLWRPLRNQKTHCFSERETEAERGRPAVATAVRAFVRADLWWSHQTQAGCRMREAPLPSPSPGDKHGGS